MIRLNLGTFNLFLLLLLFISFNFNYSSHYFSDSADYFDILDILSEKWFSTQLTHNVSAKATNAFWRLAVNWMGRMFHLRQRDGVTRKIPQFQNQRLKLYNEKCPRVSMTFVYNDVNTDETHIVHDVERAPRRRFEQKANIKKMYEVATVKVSFFLLLKLLYFMPFSFFHSTLILFQIADIKNIHSNVCTSFNSFPRSHIQLSLDGVQESKSSGITVDTYSINFKDCRNVYPLKCIKPFNRFKFNEQKTLSEVLHDINCLLYTSPSPRDRQKSRMPSSA